jgi:hypothetical protein
MTTFDSQQTITAIDLSKLEESASNPYLIPQ